MFDSKVIGRHVAFMRVMAQRGPVEHVVLAAIHAAVSELVIFPRSGGHLSKLGMVRAEVTDGKQSTGVHG